MEWGAVELITCIHLRSRLRKQGDRFRKTVENGSNAVSNLIFKNAVAETEMRFRKVHSPELHELCIGNAVRLLDEGRAELREGDVHLEVAAVIHQVIAVLEGREEQPRNTRCDARAIAEQQHAGENASKGKESRFERNRAA